MAKIPARASNRIADGLKKYQPVIESIQSRDLNESDTARVVTDILSELFGFDRYTEISSEYSVRNTYCDLAIVLNDKAKLLIEVKAVGVELKDKHVKQAVDYAANHGMDWVLLTNGVVWRLFKVIFGKPIDKEEVVQFNFLSLEHKKESDIEMLFLFSKEGLAASALSEYHAQVKAVNRFALAAVMRSESLLKMLRRELARLSPDVKIAISDIEEVLVGEVLKRDLVDSPEAKEALKKVSRVVARRERRRESLAEAQTVDAGSTTPDEAVIPEPATAGTPGSQA